MDRFVDDIINIIVTYLDYPSLYSFVLTCKKYRKLYQGLLITLRPHYKSSILVQIVRSVMGYSDWMPSDTHTGRISLYTNITSHYMIYLLNKRDGGSLTAGEALTKLSIVANLCSAQTPFHISNGLHTLSIGTFGKYICIQWTPFKLPGEHQTDDDIKDRLGIEKRIKEYASGSAKDMLSEAIKSLGNLDMPRYRFGGLNMYLFEVDKAALLISSGNYTSATFRSIHGLVKIDIPTLTFSAGQLSATCTLKNGKIIKKSTITDTSNSFVMDKLKNDIIQVVDINENILTAGELGLNKLTDFMNELIYFSTYERLGRQP